MNNTLVVAKVEDTDNMKQFNSFDMSIEFVFDRFEDSFVHFLDIKINVCETD